MYLLDFVCWKSYRNIVGFCVILCPMNVLNKFINSPGLLRIFAIFYGDHSVIWKFKNKNSLCLHLQYSDILFLFLVLLLYWLDHPVHCWFKIGSNRYSHIVLKIRRQAFSLSPLNTMVVEDWFFKNRLSYQVEEVSLSF